MAIEEHVALLKQGVNAWNAWREDNPNVRPDLSNADLSKLQLFLDTVVQTGPIGVNPYGESPGINLVEANLSDADLSGANLSDADLSSANLAWADVSSANLIEANLSEADLHEADLHEANLTRTNLSNANLSNANLKRTDFFRANLFQADLTRANLTRTDFFEANLSGANLSGALLYAASLVEADITQATLTGCRIYGMSTWGLKLNEETKQKDLIITAPNEPEITVDNIEVAQFIYLLLHNEKIRDVIDTVGKKGVLILGRFTPERKKVLDAIRDELRRRNYLPILFDFEKPADRDITETVSLLAHMARFIVADLTDPSSIPKELEAVVPRLAVPVQSVIEEPAQPFSMFKDLLKYDWMLRPYQYEGLDQLLATFEDKVIMPAEEKVKALEEKRRMIKVELTQPQ